MENIVNKTPMYASNIFGKTNENKVITFLISSPFQRVYKVASKQAKNIVIYDKNEKLLIEGIDFNITLLKDELYYLKIQTNNSNQEFYLKMECDEIAVPYRLNIFDNGKNIPLYSKSEIDPLKPALIECKLRPGGTYLYSNVPESMPLEAIDSVLMQNNNLTGDCFITFEHQNKSGLPYVYLGYRIINNNSFDIYVTVRNVGYQVNGSWLGEKSWMDYYGVHYEMDTSSFDENALKWFKDYLNFDTNYRPNAIKPTTYRIPRGKYFYVIGGTTADSFNNIDVNNTANLKITPNNCANGNAFFTINNGRATGELCAYLDVDKINGPNKIVQNFRKYGENDDMGGRIGSSNHHGVVDTNPIWVFNDATPSGYLPTIYYPYYADSLKDNYVPMEKIEGCYKHEYHSDRWLTHLSAQLNHNFVGTDMVENTTYFEGKEIILSTNIANPAGKIWDFGNWMIEYQDNIVLVNQGNKDRKIKLYIKNMGSLFYIIKDDNENILYSSATLLSCTGHKEIYEYIVPAHSRKVLSVQFVLAANNNGSVEHIVELGETHEKFYS